MRCASALRGLIDASSHCLTHFLFLRQHEARVWRLTICIILHADVLSYKNGQLDRNMYASFLYFYTLISFAFLLLSDTVCHSHSLQISFYCLHLCYSLKYYISEIKKKFVLDHVIFFLFLILIRLFAHFPNMCLMFLFPLIETKGQQYLWELICFCLFAWISPTPQWETQRGEMAWLVNSCRISETVKHAGEGARRD